MEYSINVNGKMMDLSQPRVMGILNVTPDSFYSESRAQTKEMVVARVREMLAQGADIIDVGACSTRPGSEPASAQEEMQRLRMALRTIRQEVADVVLSIDTFRPDVAKMAFEEFGADIINDVGEGSASPLGSAKNCQLSTVNSPLEMFRTVSRLGVPYVLMSRQPTVETILMDFAERVQQLRDIGQKDIILDPGFGFGKTMEQNFAVLNEQDRLLVMGLPLLVGVSRKRMVYNTLGTTPAEALNGTTVLNTIALMKGASILRVHDVREAVESVRLVKSLTTV
jgi:dihydropteroate synthase